MSPARHADPYRAAVPGGGTRNGLPEPGGYRWNGGLADPRTPREIAADNRAELEARRRQQAPPAPPPPAPARRCPACGYLRTAPGHHVTCGTRT